MFVNMSWKQYWQYISMKALSKQCNVTCRDLRIFINPCSLVVGCNTACCMAFKDLLP